MEVIMLIRNSLALALVGSLGLAGCATAPVQAADIGPSYYNSADSVPAAYQPGYVEPGGYYAGGFGYDDPLFYGPAYDGYYGFGGFGLALGDGGFGHGFDHRGDPHGFVGHGGFGHGGGISHVGMGHFGGGMGGHGGGGMGGHGGGGGHR
jgi:hypothetical protein